MPAYFLLGATSDIGGQLARLLVEKGDSVYLAGRNLDRLNAIATELNLPFSQVDASDFASVDAAMNDAVNQLGPLHGAVNLAGSVMLKPAHLTSSSDWQSTIASNLTSAFALVRSSATRMSPEGGSIVLISSAAAQIGLTNHEAIAAAKAGVEGLIRSAAATYAHKNIRVNGIAPGLVETKLTERIWNQAKAAEFSRSLHSLGRFGVASEIARGIAWLLSPDQGWVTGQVIGIDGGLGKLKTIRP